MSAELLFVLVAVELTTVRRPGFAMAVIQTSTQWDPDDDTYPVQTRGIPLAQISLESVDIS